jgi:peptide/nickel transport system substrate-binding protein
VDRVVWRVVPDPATAANALAAGEVDWLELPQPDLISMLKARPGVSTGLLDLYGTVGLLRPNHLHAPTNNAAIRRVMLAAVDQRETMTAAMGEDPTTWTAPMGFIVPGTPSASEAGMDAVRVRKTEDQLKRMLEQSGYKGETLVYLHPTDQLIYHAMSLVVVDIFRKIGLRIDEQLTDWGTIVQRRPSREPLDKGGWSMFPAGAPAPEFLDPMLSNPMRSNGSKAWFGWPDDPKLEAAYEAWLDASTDAERRKLETEYQLAAFNSVPIIPCGQYKPHAAWRSNVTGIVKGSAPVFWGAEKA